MAEHWLLLALLIVTTVVLRASGPLALGGRDLPRWLIAMVTLTAPALLAALVITNTFRDGAELAIDERLAGVAAAGGALALRSSIVVAVILAAAVTAVLRALV